MLDAKAYDGWIGHAVHDRSGTRIGDLIQVYLDPTGAPQWLVVKRGTLTTRTDLVPASAASVGSSGLELSVDTATIHGSPKVDRHHMSSDDEKALNDYYGIGSTG
jgi:hypothetical protein